MKLSVPVMRLSEYQDLLKPHVRTRKRNFVLVLVEIHETNPDALLISIDDDPPVAVNHSSRKIFEKEVQGMYRWPAGGSGVILDLADHQILVLIHKDAAAPSYAGFDTIGAGLGCSDQDIFSPLRIALREGIEEILIQSPQGIVCPQISSRLDPFGFNVQLYEGLQDCMRIVGINEKIIFDPFQMIDLPGSKRLDIRWRGQTSRTQGLINLDHSCNGIDLVTAIRMRLDCTLDELTIFDAEVDTAHETDQIKDGIWTNRTVNAYQLIDLRPTGRVLASWKSGQRIDHPQVIWPHPLIPHTKQLIDALSKM